MCRFTLSRHSVGMGNAMKRYYIHSKLLFCNSWKTGISHSRARTLRNAGSRAFYGIQKMPESLYIYAKWCFFTVHDRIAPKSVKRHILGGKKVLLFTLLRVPRGEENATKRYYIHSKIDFVQFLENRNLTLAYVNFAKSWFPGNGKMHETFVYMHIIAFST